MADVRQIILRFCAVLWLAFGASSVAHAEIPVTTCIAPLPAASAGPAGLNYDCSPVQNKYGAGDFAVQLRFAPVQAGPGDPLVFRTSSVWQSSERIVFHYADGTTSELEFNAKNARHYMTIGAIFEFPVPTHAAPLDGISAEVKDSANWRGVMVGAHLLTSSQSYRVQSWLVALYAAFGGLSLALLAYNLSLWSVLRHPFQLSYAAMVSALMAYTFTSSSIAMLVIPALENNDRLRLNYVFLALAAVASIRFMADFFGPRVFGPKLRRVAILVCGATLLSAAGFALLAPWQGYWLDRLYLVACSAALLLILPIVVVAWRSKVPHLGLFMIAWSPPVIASIVRAAYGAGLIDYNFWFDNGNLIALSIESLLSTMLIVVRLRDLSSERDRAMAGEQSALRLANSDPLTGLLNRRAFIQMASSRGAAHRLLLVDIDRFKAINDRLGHDAGDDVLRAVAEVLQKCRPADSLAVRLGGEEFALLVPLQYQQQCTPEQVLAAVRAKAMPLDWKVTVSLGYADGRLTCEEDWRRLYRLADAALYRAKADGRDRACRATDFAEINAA